jgi:hypothetical protein
MEKYLPLGSIVLLEGGEKRIMIYGRRQKALADAAVWDYIACLYPEGNLNDEHTYLFNHEQIERVFFIGFQENEEFAFQAALHALVDEDGRDGAA